MARNGIRACAVLVLTATSMAAQEPTPPSTLSQDAKVTVTIGNTAAPPEWELSVPVSLKVTADAEVGRVSLRLLYPTKALRYTSVRASETLKKANFDVKGGTPKIANENGEIMLTIQPAAGQKPDRLPSGTVAIVVFRVTKDAPEKSWPMTAESVEAWGTLPEAASVSAAAGPAGKFIVTPPGLPILSCFFYMH
ncbi:MAG: hypothetical protein H0W08_27470 [Acidobacteria bacterium]|nr:hypothetical protein [Acidobacteriota bacterium]